MLQEYCRRLGVGTSPAELAELVATLRELPLGHPLGRLLRETRDFADDDALADALCNPRERSYDVAELFELLDGAGLRFGRWEQPGALPARLRRDQRDAARGAHRRAAGPPTSTRWSSCSAARSPGTRRSRSPPTTRSSARSTSPTAPSTGGCPSSCPTAVAVEERLPAGAAAALINRAHIDTDLVLFVDRRQLDDLPVDRRAAHVGELGPGAAAFVERLWRHDLVVFDTTGAEVGR